MIAEEYHIYFTLAVLAGLILFLIWDKFKSSYIFGGALALLYMSGILSTSSLLGGFSNTSILSILILISITASLNEHFDLSKVLDKLIGNSKKASSFILRMGSGVAITSSFMNNTPVVAVMMPYVYQWGKKNNVDPSKLLLPLSYAAILGGMITLIGTSTNLVLNGLIISNNGEGLSTTDIIVPGLLVSVFGLLFLYFFGPKLLKNKTDFNKDLVDEAREYQVEFRVRSNSKIIGKSIENAGLRNLEGLFLAQLERNGELKNPVSPQELLESGDALFFVGDTKNIIELLNHNQDLELNPDSTAELDITPHYIEAIVSQNSSLDRFSPKEIGFREKYDAAIIGVHRQGERLDGKIGSRKLKTGDLLLLSPGKDFNSRSKRGKDLLILSQLESSKKKSRSASLLFIGLSAFAILLGLLGTINLFQSLLIILSAQFIAGMNSLEKLKNNLSMDLLFILMSSLGIGKALIDSGSADFLSEVLFANTMGLNPFGLLLIVYLTSFLLTSFVTNIAAISILFPLIFALGLISAVEPKALYITAAFGASCCFATPYAYQTNLMVQEAGNYRFKDFLRIGVPLATVYSVVFLTYAYFTFL